MSKENSCLAAFKFKTLFFCLFVCLVGWLVGCFFSTFTLELKYLLFLGLPLVSIWNYTLSSPESPAC